MTLKEFTDKYQVPYYIVYEASYKVPAINTMRKDREYPEKQLFAEVRSLLGKRITKNRERLAMQERILDGMRCVHP